MNRFLYSVRDDLASLWVGLNMYVSDGNMINVRAILLMGTCDLPEKSECLNFIQFNGNYGCPSRLLPGECVLVNPEDATEGHVHVYLRCNELQPRTVENCIEYANRATIDIPYMGVKGGSALSKLMPDYIRGMAIDRMHGVDAGVVKKTLILLFDAKYNNCPFSLHSSH